MTDITLTQAQIDKVLEENQPIDPPIDPPPIDPPIDPDPPPIDPPVDPGPTTLFQIYFSDVWGTRLTEPNPRNFYRNQNIYNRRAAGTCMKIRLPFVSRRCFLKITDVENTGTPPNRYGRLSWSPNFDGQAISERVWGIGGGVMMEVTPEMGGREVYFLHRIHQPDERFAPWWSTLQAIISS